MNLTFVIATFLSLAALLGCAPAKTAKAADAVPCTEASTPSATPMLSMRGENPAPSPKETSTAPIHQDNKDKPSSTSKDQAIDWKALHQAIDVALAKRDTATAIALLRQQVTSRNDAAEVARRTMQLAQLLAARNQENESLDLLGQLATAQMASLDMLDSADQLEQTISLRRESKAADALPALKAFSNLAAAGTTWDELSPMADSLRPLLSDSLRLELNQRMNLARKRSLGKARAILDTARALGVLDARFDLADKAMGELRNRYPSFLDTIGYQKVLQEVSREFDKYDSTKASHAGTPESDKVLAKARQLRDAKKLLEARDQYAMLMTGKHRRVAIEESESVAESYCEEKRRAASDYFSQSRKAGLATSKSKVLVTTAIAELDRCLKEFPDAKVVGKVRQNRATLAKQLPNGERAP